MKSIVDEKKKKGVKSAKKFFGVKDAGLTLSGG